MKYVLMLSLLILFSCGEDAPDPGNGGGGELAACLSASEAEAQGYDLSHLEPRHNKCAPTTSNPTKCFCTTDEQCHTRSKCKK